jgi:methyl-accepting chemotaxis protein
MLIVIAAGVVLAIVIGLFISRSISKPVALLVEAADNLAIGNMDIEPNIYTKDEIGKLAESFRNLIESTREQALVVEKIADADLTVDVTVRSDKDLMGKKLSQLVNGLNEMMANIASASDQVAVGSKQISDSSMALSQGATEQASSIEELTASIEEISSQTKHNAQNANQANELAEDAKSDAIKGNTQMQEMLKAMEEINEASANISKVIKVIDDIAFQTNMLALNAAVEAARVGQHGKGFAVVAEEVKNLATRSANAAKETTEMIEGSIQKSEIGTKIAKDTAEALNNIVDEIEKVATLVNDIAAASNEQDAGIAQINQGIVQVSQVVQNNSATSEESAAASEELSGQAELLKDLVDKFKLKKDINLHNGLEEISPEVLKMLDDMSQKGKKNSQRDKSEESAKNKKIILSDSEFGKY